MHVLINALLVSTTVGINVGHVHRCVVLDANPLAILYVVRTVRIAVMTIVYIRVVKSVELVHHCAFRVPGYASASAR